MPQIEASNGEILLNKQFIALYYYVEPTDLYNKNVARICVRRFIDNFILFFVSLINIQLFNTDLKNTALNMSKLLSYNKTNVLYFTKISYLKFV